VAVDLFSEAAVEPGAEDKKLGIERDVHGKVLLSGRRE
jgi:hypothetical protein